MPRYKIAGVVFNTNHIYSYTPKLCEKYVYCGSEPDEITINMTEKVIETEKSIPGAENFSDSYLESLALFRKLCDYILEKKSGIIFHSSAIMMDGKAYLFTAPSGTGKSTHTKLWKKVFKDEVVYINDDKPIIRYEDGDFYVYGTPWNGKHHLDNNIRVKVDAICHLCRGEVNKITKISPQEMLMIVLNQTIRPKDLKLMENLLIILDKLLTSVKLFRLECNMEEEAALVAKKGLMGE